MSKDVPVDPTVVAALVDTNKVNVKGRISIKSDLVFVEFEAFEAQSLGDNADPVAVVEDLLKRTDEMLRTRIWEAYYFHQEQQAEMARQEAEVAREAAAIAREAAELSNPPSVTTQGPVNLDDVFGSNTTATASPVTNRRAGQWDATPKKWAPKVPDRRIGQYWVEEVCGYTYVLGDHPYLKLHCLPMESKFNKEVDHACFSSMPGWPSGANLKEDGERHSFPEHSVYVVLGFDGTMNSKDASKLDTVVLLITRSYDEAKAQPQIPLK